MSSIFRGIIKNFYLKFNFVESRLSKRNLSDLDRDLYQARMPFTGKEYGVAAIGISSVLAVFSLISYALYPEYSLAIIFLVFAFSMILFFNYPKTRKKRISKEIDRDLPYALTSIGSEMNINVPFEKTIENVANSGYGEVSKEFKKVLIDIKNGFSIQESLTNFSDRIDSSFVKRAVAIIITAYGKGGRSGDLLKKLADEYNSVAQAKLREYNGKVVLYSLIFIAFSAIIPAMFQTFVIIGSSFMVLIITPEMAFWIPAAVFPVTNACILLIMRSKRP